MSIMSLERYEIPREIKAKHGEEFMGWGVAQHIMRPEVWIFVWDRIWETNQHAQAIVATDQAIKWEGV